MRKPKPKKMREQIADLTLALERTKTNERRLYQELTDAHEKAYNQFVRQAGTVDRAAAVVADKMGQILGERLLPFAKEILKHRRKISDMPLFDITTSINMQDAGVVVHGEIPSINFSIIVDG